MKVGEKVSVISESIKGEVISVEDNIILIVDEDGFTRTYDKSELVKNSEEDYRYNIGDLKEKIELDNSTYNIQIRTSDKYKNKDFWEIDLHIDKLLDEYNHLSNTEIVRKQMAVFKSFFDRVKRNNIRKSVVIHGKGKGVLKAEIHDYLRQERNNLDVNLEFLDAAYSEYGIGGATEINIY